MKGAAWTPGAVLWMARPTAPQVPGAWGDKIGFLASMTGLFPTVATASSAGVATVLAVQESRALC